MSAEQLLRYYERIADAPDAIRLLRRFVIDLAVRGKVVPQDESGEPASELLERIRKSDPRGVRSRTLNGLAVGGIDGHPANQLPPGWCHSTLGEVAECLDFKRRPVNEAERAKRIDGKDEATLVPYFGATQQQGWIDEWIFDDEIVLLGEDGVAFFDRFRPKAYLVSGKSWVNNHAHVFRGLLVSNPFLVLCLNATDYAGFIAGATRTKLNQSRALEIRVPLPPLPEQHRIVAKVDELMALCDRLAAARAEREAARDRMAAASLARLNAPDPETFADDARFALNALTALTARPDQIKQLRQTILNLAVQGKLSPAADWQARPVLLGNVASLQNGYAFKSEWFSTTGIRLLRNANVAHGSLNWSETVHLPEERAAEYERFRLREGDVVLSLDRPFIVTGTKVSTVTESDLPALLLQRVGRFVLSEELQSDYLLLWINSPHFSGQIDPGRSNGVPHISSKQVEAAEIFLPPLAEQRRLVAKVNVILLLCDRLEASLAVGEARRHSLLEVLLHETLEPAEALEEAA